MTGRDDITGLVLAGGRGSRMGGADKGLQSLHGRPLARHAVQRLQPQVGGVLISANRNADAYASLGWPVVADTLPDRPGPLAGILAGLERCTTPCLVAVPCDAPMFPADLVSRLAAALDRSGSAVAVAATREGGVERLQPAFCLMRAEVRAGLAAFLSGGGRKVAAWAEGLGAAVVVFDDEAAFANVNSLAELERMPPP